MGRGLAEPDSGVVTFSFPVPKTISEQSAVVEELRALAGDLRELLGEAGSRGAGPVSWSEPDAATELGISELTLKRLRRAGRISYTPVGNKARYTRAHLEDFLERNTQHRKGGKR